MQNYRVWRIQSILDSPKTPIKQAGTENNLFTDPAEDQQAKYKNYIKGCDAIYWSVVVQL